MSLWACGPKLPARYVIETDLDGYRYRRYQQVLDVELPIEGNAAVAHTATYVRGGETVHVAPVVLTTYEQAAGLTESVRQRLRGMDGYTLEVVEQGGDHVWRMRGAAGDLWVLWVSDKYLAKIGAPDGEKEVPSVLVEAYLDLYPSDLDDKGKAKSGRSSAGPAVTSASAAASDPNAPAQATEAP
ncbi:MAG: hypothetical protein QM778_02115 [Myxococcales bacterium]